MRICTPAPRYSLFSNLLCCATSSCRRVKASSLVWRVQRGICNVPASAWHHCTTLQLYQCMLLASVSLCSHFQQGEGQQPGVARACERGWGAEQPPASVPAALQQGQQDARDRCGRRDGCGMWHGAWAVHSGSLQQTVGFLKLHLRFKTVWMEVEQGLALLANAAGSSGVHMGGHMTAAHHMSAAGM